MRSKYKHIFISWSNKNSKAFANYLKEILEKEIFKNTDLRCFVSSVDIASGEDWWAKIKKELKISKMGIVCITKENINAPWIYYEAGAMVARGCNVVPLIIGCNPEYLKDTPLSGNQRKDFFDEKQFSKMVFDINKLDIKTTNGCSIKDKDLKPAIKRGYEKLKKIAANELEALKNMRVFNEKYIYPQSVTTVNKDTIYVCVPMASTPTEKKYEELHQFVKELNVLLTKNSEKTLRFRTVYCPALEKETQLDFDGANTAIKQNFIKMKQVDCMLVVYPELLPSSLLVEIGYGIALCKRIVIFYRDKLPYMLQDAGNEIEHVKVKHFDTYKDIIGEIKSNGRDLFDMDEE